MFPGRLLALVAKRTFRFWNRHNDSPPGAAPTSWVSLSQSNNLPVTSVKLGGSTMKKHSTRFIGLDTHNDSIAVAYATDSRTEPVTYLGAIGTQHYAIRKMVR